ncbi:uncharacterized protein N7469_000523 [Penicillium citrinum]|uniref:Myb-like domain-containing protein n=1 Tax=Penicillium citrinum TaxID=5077 RepID=A0A9W9PD24_PENCI|nr:uncharacterized protein N7469_000523 [Penicillium citrinum]KAJ5242196.1 hypothetical protein N7469_000523 [Penicillium citrinum]
MKSFSSSAINKSGKKFAPKAPARRGAPAPAAPARRPSAVQQSQVQSAQNAQQERDVRGSVGSIAPSSVASVEPEPLAIPETTPPVTVAQTQERPPIISRPATSIPIPRPKRRGSVSTPATQEPTIVPTPPNDVPPSPRSSAIEPPAESEIVPSIEQDVELPAGHGVTVPSTQPADDAVAPNEITSPRPTAVQNSAPIAAPRPSFMPVEYQPAKRAKKTSEITKSRQKSQSRGGSLAPSTPEPSQASKTSKKRKQSRAGASDAEGTDKTKRTRRVKREPTPEGAETVEILPNVMKMSELCKDLKTGKKSKREIELRRLEQIELEEKQKAQEEGSAAGTPKKNKTPDATKKDENRPPEAKGPSGPVMRIVNGEIVLDTASLEVDRHADAAREAGDLEDVVENQLTRKINQASYGKRSKTESWDEEMTDLFYRGLRMFGTDFMIISNMFPGRSRRQIKLKFNNEERRDPQRIRDTLMGPREVVDIETYTAMTNQTYDDPKVIQQELDEEKRAIEEQHEKEKQLHEEMMRNPTGGAEEDTKGDKGKGTGKGKSRNSKRQAKNLGGGGTEEVLGSIDEIPAF